MTRTTSNVAEGGEFPSPQSAPGQVKKRRLVLERLRVRIAKLEAATPSLAAPVEAKPGATAAAWTFGLPEIDCHLPQGGLEAAAVHEIAAAEHGDLPAALGFAAALAVRRLGSLSEDARPLLWCRFSAEVREWGRVYGHGLEALGLPREKLLTVTLNRPEALLWTLEEALKCASLAGVIADAGPGIDLTVTRRLMLAAGQGGTPGLLVFASPPQGGTAGRTRWSIAARPSARPAFDEAAPGAPAWDVSLTRCRGGRPGQWSVEWHHATHRFALASAVSGRTADARGAPAGQPAYGARPAAGADRGWREGLAARRL
jgi:protein ImuA